MQGRSVVSVLCVCGLKQAVCACMAFVPRRKYLLHSAPADPCFTALSFEKRCVLCMTPYDRPAVPSWLMCMLCLCRRLQNNLITTERPAVSSCLQVCGLKWSPDDREIASGGNDNQLYIWNLNSTSPVIKFSDHNAAVKAIAWSPHQHGLLASGGGTADRCIRFWNSATNTALNCIDTGMRCAVTCCVMLCCAVVRYAFRQHESSGMPTLGQEV